MMQTSKKWAEVGQIVMRRWTWILSLASVVSLTACNNGPSRSELQPDSEPEYEISPNEAKPKAMPTANQDYWTVAILESATVVLVDKSSISKEDGQIVGNFVIAYGSPQLVSGLNANAQMVRMAIRCDADVVTWTKRLIFEPNAEAPVLRPGLPSNMFATGSWMRGVQQYFCFGANNLEYLSPLPGKARTDLISALRLGSAMAIEAERMTRSENYVN